MKSTEYQKSSPIRPNKDSYTQCDFIIGKHQRTNYAKTYSNSCHAHSPSN